MKVSIIIPVYNAEKYLRRCLDSVLAQSFEDWECLLVDDGSKDSSGSVCDEYASRDSRFRVFHKENGGVSSARNCGLDNASGEWIGFIDSDDYVSPDFLQNFMDLPQDVDLLQQGFYSIGAWWGMLDIDKISIYNEDNVVREKDKVLSLINNMMDVDLHPYIWCKLFSRKKIEESKLHFQEDINYQEDFLFAFDYYSKISSAANNGKCGYYYNFPQRGKNYGVANQLGVYRRVFSTMMTFPAEKHEIERFKIHILKRISHYCFKSASFAGIKDFVRFFMWVGQNFSREIIQKSFGNNKSLLLLKRLYVGNPIASLLLFSTTYAIINARNVITRTNE